MGQEGEKGLYDLPKGAERRKHKRYRIEERGIIRNQGISSSCVVHNFSEGGALLESDVLLSEGAEVEVQSATLGRLAATVVRVGKNRLMVRFKEKVSIDPPRQAADMREANLFRAELADADLSGADLFRADLTEAFLGKADLSGANLGGADLTGADLTGADNTARQLVLANDPLEATLDDDLRTGLKALLAEAERKANEGAGGE